MISFKYDSDMASDLKNEKGFNQDYDFYEENGNYYHLEYIHLKKDDDIYYKKKGDYISIQFEDIEVEECFCEIKDKVCEIIKKMTTKICENRIDKVLICGLGNIDLSCDRLGPLLKNRILINEIGHTFLLIPGVKGQTGIETYDLIHSYVKHNQPDLILIVDALATRNIDRMNHVIQLTDTGIRPGSGIGNECVEISKESLGVPVIALGVPTVVRVVNIVLDVLNHLKIDNYDDLESKMKESHLNQVVMDKGCDMQIENLANLIAASINKFLYEGN